MKKSSQPIIISGSPRSGSTWIGRVLSQHPETKYVHEPFNVGIKRDDSPLSLWQEGIITELPTEKKNKVKKYLKDFYAVTPKFILNHLSNVKGIGTLRDARWLVNERRKKRTILKDPIALFSLEWIAKEISPYIIITIRHPAAVVGSFLAKGWGYDFNDMKNQPELIDKYLLPFKDKIYEYAENQPSLIDQGILLWSIVYHTVKIYQDKHEKEWLFLKNEDLSLEPMQNFKKIMEYIEMDMTDSVKKAILNSTQGSGGTSVLEADLVRDSKQNVFSWKKRLSEEQISKIRLETEPVWKHFYSELDW